MPSKSMKFRLAEDYIPTEKRPKFEVGNIYHTPSYSGYYDYYMVVKRSPSGYITFQEVNPSTGHLKKEKFARIPHKGWEDADERVTINKGTSWTKGTTLYARHKMRRL